MTCAVAPPMFPGAMAGMRDKLIHDYFGVDLSLVWDVVASELPAARDNLADLIDVVERDAEAEQGPES